MALLFKFKLLLLFLIFCESLSASPINHDSLKDMKLNWNFLKPKTPIPFEDCGSEFDILELNIAGCTELPCHMPRGEAVNVATFFNDYGNSPNILRHRVRWDLQYVMTDAEVTPDPCFEKNGCYYEDFNGAVSLATVFVSHKLPLFVGTMDWEVSDDSDKRVMCYRVPIVITP